MQLPHAELGRVDEEKVTGYLLNAHHPYGATKARLFEQLGFSAAQWDTFAAALLQHGQTHRVAATHASPYGTRFEIEAISPRRADAAPGSGPSGRSTWVRLRHA